MGTRDFQGHWAADLYLSVMVSDLLRWADDPLKWTMVRVTSLVKTVPREETLIKICVPLWQVDVISYASHASSKGNRGERWLMGSSAFIFFCCCCCCFFSVVGVCLFIHLFISFFFCLFFLFVCFFFLHPILKSNLSFVSAAPPGA